LRCFCWLSLCRPGKFGENFGPHHWCGPRSGPSLLLGPIKTEHVPEYPPAFVRLFPDYEDFPFAQGTLSGIKNPNSACWVTYSVVCPNNPRELNTASLIPGGCPYKTGRGPVVRRAWGCLARAHRHRTCSFSGRVRSRLC